MNPPEADIDAVRAAVVRINEVWMLHRPDEMDAFLRPLFAPEMRVTGPGFTPAADGRDAAVASYADFARAATVAACELGEPTIHLARDTAVATYRWRIRYRLDAVDFDEAGHDVFVFRRDANRWLATWRAMLPDPVPGPHS